MDYDASLRWLLTLPDFERTGDFAGRPDLAPMRALLHDLGDPHDGRPTIHIAGSKGKGSTGAMIEAILRAAGLHTGYYISPHLHRYNERIRIDAAAIEQDGFAAAMTLVRAAIERVEPRFAPRRFIAFDALTAAAFIAFRAAAVDVQVVEVGLGGLLDSTNVFRPDPDSASEPPARTDRSSDLSPHGAASSDYAHVVVITPISLEHTDILGPTIPAIAEQKAGIITPGATAVVAPQRESALDVFRAACVERGANMIEVAAACQMTRTSASAEGQKFRLKTARATYEATLPLAGRHQLENAATAVLACEELCARIGVELTPQIVARGLAAVSWPARLEVLTRRPLVIIDGAHNGDSAKRMVAALRDDFGLRRATFLFGTLAGKDIDAMAAAIAPIADAVFIASWPSPRAADPRAIADAFRAYPDVLASAHAGVAAAYDAAVAAAGDRGAVVAFGSLAFVAALREHVLGIESDALRLALGA
jgi:dihydrofolate synthase/folylpolyglutamate synthase